MSNIGRAAGLAALVLAAACARPAVQLGDDQGLPAQRWQGTVTSPPSLSGAVEMQGSAWMANGEETSTTRVSVEIENAAPGGEHPWEIRTGYCGSTMARSFGDGDDFRPLEVRNDGTAATSATVEQPLPTSGEYSVVVYASPTNRDLVVACGNLAPPVN